MIPVQQQTFLIPAGGSFPLQCEGRYFRIQAATGSMKVVADSFGNMGPVGVGQGLRLKDSDPAFRRLTFIDTSGGNNTVTVVIADADFVDNSLLGTVSVVDGGKARTLSNQSFLAALDSNAGVAGTFTMLELWNPAASGKRAVVKSVSVFSSTAGFAQVRQTTAQRAGLYAAANNPLSKLAGGAVSAMQNRVETNAAVNNAGASYVDQVSMAANTLAQRLYQEPLVVLPGTGLMVFHTTQVVPLNAVFEYVEELNS